MKVDSASVQLSVSLTPGLDSAVFPPALPTLNEHPSHSSHVILTAEQKAMFDAKEKLDGEDNPFHDLTRGRVFQGASDGDSVSVER